MVVRFGLGNLGPVLWRPRWVLVVIRECCGIFDGISGLGLGVVMILGRGGPEL